MSAPSVEVRKVHNAVFLGTDTAYEKKVDPAIKGLVRAETLSFHYDMLPEDDGNSKSILDGPDTAGTNVYEKIAEGAMQLLDAIGDGANVVNISAHSRGAVEAILVANFLYQLQLACAEDANKDKNILDIIKDLQLQQTGHLDDKKDFDQSQAELNKVKAVFATNAKLREQIAKLISKSDGIKTHIADHKINILAIDPVPGDFSVGIAWVWTIASISWIDQQMFNIPPNVDHYQQYLYAHEDSRGFKPILPSPQDSTRTKVDIDILPGHHGSGSGNLCHQEGTVVTLTDGKTPGDTSTVQELLLCKLVDFSEQHSQYKFTDADVDKASEKDPNTDPEQLAVVGLTSLKDLVKKYISSHTAGESRASIRKALYKKMVANKAAYEILRAFSYYSSYIRGFGSEQSLKRTLPTSFREMIDRWITRPFLKGSIMPVESRIFYTERRDNNHIHCLDAFFRPCFTSDIVNSEHAQLQLDSVLSSMRINATAASDITNFSRAILTFITKVTSPQSAWRSISDSVGPVDSFAATPDANKIIKDFLTQILDRFIENNIAPEEDTHLKNMFAGLLTAVYSTDSDTASADTHAVNKIAIKAVITEIIAEVNQKIKQIADDYAKLLQELNSEEAKSDLELQRLLLSQATRLFNQKHKLTTCLQKLTTITSKSDVEAVNPTEISTLSATINEQAEKLKSIKAIDETDIVNIDEINKKEELIKELSDLEQQSRLRLETLTGVGPQPSDITPAPISPAADIQVSLDELHIELRNLPQPANLNFDDAGPMKNAIKQVQHVRIKELHAQKVRTLTAKITCLTLELSMAKANAAETAQTAAVAQAAAAETAQTAAVAQAAAAETARTAAVRAQTHATEELKRATIINARAVKIGCTIGLVVTVAVGATLLVYFLAPAIVPVLIAKAIVGILGSSTVMTTSLAVKSLALTAFSGIFSGLATKEITSVVEDKRIPQIQAPVLA